MTALLPAWIAEVETRLLAGSTTRAAVAGLPVSLGTVGKIRQRLVKEGRLVVAVLAPRSVRGPGRKVAVKVRMTVPVLTPVVPPEERWGWFKRPSLARLMAGR